ncbi:MAG: hypothetical protein AAFX44_10055 [Pseudomonadota bacterium]
MPDRAFLLIHGIGDFAPGLALENATMAIRRRFPDVEPDEQQVRRSTAGTTLQYSDVIWKTATIRIAEFHWAGSFGKLRRFNPLRTLWRLFQLFYVLPALGAYGSDSRRRQRLAAVAGWALVAIAVCVTVGVLALITGTFKELGRSSPPEIGLLTSVGLNLLMIGIGASFLALAFGFVGYMGTRLRDAGHSSLAAQWLGLFVGALLLLLYLIVFLYFAATVGVFFVGSLSVGAVLAGLVLFGIPLWVVLSLLLAVIDLMRDVVVYLAPTRDGRTNATTATIRQGVIDALDGLAAEGFAEITLVAHSLGSVIALEALNEWAPANGERARVSLVTCGSPLRRLLAPLLPDRFVDPITAHRALSRSGLIQFGGWLNLYRAFDYVGKRVFPRKPIDDQTSPPAVDQQLAPWITPPFGHANYWGDARFLDVIVERLLR